MKYLSLFILAAIALIVMASCEKSEIAPVVEDAPMKKEVNDKIELPRVKYGGEGRS